MSASLSVNYPVLIEYYGQKATENVRLMNCQFSSSQRFREASVDAKFATDEDVLICELLIFVYLRA